MNELMEAYLQLHNYRNWYGRDFTSEEGYADE